jgi:hypothetical protein
MRNAHSSPRRKPFFLPHQQQRARTDESEQGANELTQFSKNQESHSRFSGI